MIKLLFCLLCAFSIGVATLHLRQQQLELKHETARLQSQIDSQQSKLWNQQLQIAAATAPRVLKQTIAQHHLPLATDPRIPSPAGNWTNSPTDALME
jgi:cell division protein FtsL